MEETFSARAAKILILELAGECAGTLGRDSRYVYKSSGGTIGRAADNSWVLPEQSVSATHARIEFSNIGFTLTDISRNGIDLAESGEALERGRPYLISNGMRFLIGEFEIEATLLDDDGLPFPEGSMIQTDDDIA